MTAKLPLEISVQEAHAVITDHNAVVIDVREPWEVQTASIGNVTAIPLTLLPEKVQDLDKECSYLVLCHHGVRSLQACLYLRQNEFANVASIKGGIHAWSLTIDGAVPCY